MRCPHCSFDNDPDDTFCGGCGAPIEHRCPACGSRNKAHRRFCARCGAALHDPSIPLDHMRDAEATAARDAAIDKELEQMKSLRKQGFLLQTCPHCGTKNRVALSKRFDRARCGRCGATLPAAVDLA